MSKRKQKSRVGAVVVEFALLVPIFLLIFVASVEICNTVFFEQTLKTSAYEGARVAIVPGATVFDVEMTVKEVTDARNIGSVTVNIIPVNFDTLPVESLITIEVTAPRQHSTLLSGFISSNASVTERVTMMKEY